MENHNENVIEFLRNEERATVTLSQGRFISKIRKLADKHPAECQIVAENSDGSIVAHIPTKWIKITPERKMSEEAREKSSQRMKEYNQKHIS